MIAAAVELSVGAAIIAGVILLAIGATLGLILSSMCVAAYRADRIAGRDPLATRRDRIDSPRRR